MLSFGANVKIVSSGGNVIIWCYHVMLSAGMITHPFFIFPENFTYSCQCQKTRKKALLQCCGRNKIRSTAKDIGWDNKRQRLGNDVMKLGEQSQSRYYVLVNVTVTRICHRCVSVKTKGTIAGVYFYQILNLLFLKQTAIGCSHNSHCFIYVIKKSATPCVAAA